MMIAGIASLALYFVLLPLRIVLRFLTNVEKWYENTTRYVVEIKGAGKEIRGSNELDEKQFDKLEGKSSNLRNQARFAPNNIVSLGVSGDIKDNVRDLARYCERGITILPDLYESESFSETIEIYLKHLDRIDREGRYWSRPIFTDASPSDVQGISLENVMRRSNIIDEDTISELGGILEDCEAVKDEKIPKEKFEEKPVESLFEYTSLTWEELSSEIPWEKMDDVVDKRNQRSFNKELTRELVTVYFIDKPDELIDMIEKESNSVFALCARLSFSE